MLMNLLRSFLFVPADSSRKMLKARNLRPDAFIYDLEDAVPLDKKLEARDMLAEELQQTAGLPAKIFVRVNRFGTSFFKDDLRAAVRPGVYGIVLPKPDAAGEVAEVDQQILELERRMGMPERGMRLMPILESAKGVLHASELARSSSRILALNFGGEDYCVDMGISRTKAGEEIFFARSIVALAAKSEGLQAIDGVFTDFNDATGLLDETQRMKQMGFTGKTLIHPNQIETVHHALAPSAEEIAWAEEVVTAFESARSGVTVVHGKMVDEPVVLQARRILNMALPR
ncbi:MAG: aldolase/citrate lyase family protein [Candidatus Acidiferrum sp.]